MSAERCECCLKLLSACHCCGPRETICDFCNEPIADGAAFYESAAYRRVKGEVVECGQDSVVLSCERCESERMRAVKRSNASKEPGHENG